MAFEFDVTPWSGQPVHEVMNATLMFEEASGSAVGSQFALVMLSDDFDGTANLSRPMAGGTWTDPSRSHPRSAVGPGPCTSSMSPPSLNMPPRAEMAMFVSVSPFWFPRDAPCTSEVIRIHSSEASSLEDRPMLNLTVRNGTSWTPPAPTLVQPNDVVLWNRSGPGSSDARGNGHPTSFGMAHQPHQGRGRLSNASDFWNGSGARHGHGTQIPMRAPSTSHPGPSRFHRASNSPSRTAPLWSIIGRCGPSWTIASVPGPLPLDSAFLMLMEPMTARRTTP